MTRFNPAKTMKSYELKNLRELRMIGKKSTQPKVEEPKQQSKISQETSEDEDMKDLAKLFEIPIQPE